MNKIATLTTQECTNLINYIEASKLELNTEGWGRDRGDRLDRRYGYTFPLGAYQEIIVANKLSSPTLIWIKDFPDWLLKIRDTYYPEANSITLVEGIKPNTTTSIGLHVDNGLFKEKVIVVNLGEADFSVRGENKNAPYKLLMGDVIEFDSMKFHVVNQTSDKRCVIQMRETKNTYPIVQ